MYTIDSSKILYVEDEEAVRESVARALRRRTKEVVTAING